MAHATSPQIGPRNYIGPVGTCPPDATSCIQVTGNIDASIYGGSAGDPASQTQTAPDVLGLGRYNKIVAPSGATTVFATQSDAPNSADCSMSTTVDVANLVCNVTQSGGPNTITGSMSATPTDGTNGLPVNTANITQNSKLQVVGSQTSESTNKLTITQLIDQGANALVNVGSPPPIPHHTQDTFEYVAVSQGGTGNNIATVTQNRKQSSTVTGRTPVQLQDSQGVPAAADGATTCSSNGQTFPLGNATECVHQSTGGAATNTLTYRAFDKKVINGTDITNTSTTQQQGTNGVSEIRAGADLQSSTTCGGSVDMGTPNDSPAPRTWDPGQSQPDGTFKSWTMQAKGLTSASVGGQGHQYDQISIPGSLLSPCDMKTNEGSELYAPLGTFQHARVEASGNADGPAGWVYAQDALLKTGAGCTSAGSCTQNESGHAQNLTGLHKVNAVLDCTQNSPNTCFTTNGQNVSSTENTPITQQPIATITTADSQQRASDFTVNVNWGEPNGSSNSTGDGTNAVTVTGPQGGPFTVLGTHNYVDEGTYTITTVVSAVNDSATTTSVANIADAALTAGPATATAGVAGHAFSGSVGSFTDGNTAAPTSDFTATINWGDGSPSTAGTVSAVPNVAGAFTVSGGPHTFATGTYTVTTTVTDKGGATPITLTMTYTSAGCITDSSGNPTGCFVIGNLAGGTPPLQVGAPVTWWSSQWNAANPTTGGDTSSSFKGWENTIKTAPTTCGGTTPPTWQTKSTGNSAPPPPLPSQIPDYMTVLVTSSVGGGSTPAGNVVAVVLVQNTKPTTYNGSPSGPGTGTIKAVLCPA